MTVEQITPNFNSSQRAVKTITFGPATASGTSTGSTATTLTDALAAWTIDAYIGLTVYSDGKSGVVTTNSDTVLTVDSWTGGTPTAVKGYMVGAAGLDGGIGARTLFTVTGIVIVRAFIQHITTKFVDVAADTARMSLGVTGVTNLFSGLVGSFSANTGDNYFGKTSGWQTAGVGLIGNLASAVQKDVVIGANIIQTTDNGTIIAGVYEAYALWDPLTDGATLVAA